MARISGQAFAQSYVELHKVRSVQFGLLNPDEVRKMSVIKIENERTYDDRGIPSFGGINDPRMGTMDKELKCFTCKGTQADCPGHFGHIELAKPVYHAGLLEYIRKILRCVCHNCSRLLLEKQKLPEIKSIKSQKARFAKVLKYCDGTKECDPQAGGCGHKQPKFTKTGLRIQIEHLDEQYDAGRDRKQVFYPDDALKVLERIKDEDCELLGMRAAISRPENMIIKNLAVAPPPVRPSVSMTNTMRSEDDLTYAYLKIVQTNIQLQTQINRGANQTTINELRQNLQYYVATLMDNEIQGQPTQKHKSGKPLKAIRARLRGKEGRLRGNLMGKRVDFSARTVITPDPILQLDQLGVPKQIALNLTVPETVTSENIDDMRRLIQNGPHIWPGAKYIIRHDDRQIDLSQMRNRSDAHLEPGYRVERHLKDGDYVIFNRQPSLHKMSLMGHRVKVLPFSTFRLNLSVTSPYNADFDGDEMNMHVPQSYETMAEIKEIMAVPNQIVSPQSNKPVMGIVQDSLLGVMLFTLKDCFIEKELVMNLLMWANYEEDKFPFPTILKPKPLWTGKQIFSLIIPNINLMRRAKKKDTKEKEPWDSAGDKNILIKKGELICGNLTKGTIGSSSGGMIHIIWKEKGPYSCRDFLSNTQLIINNWLHQHGFTVGVEDIIARKETILEMRSILKKQKRTVQKVLQDAQMGLLKSQPGKSMMETYEASVNTVLNSARDLSGNLALNDLHSWNRLKAMVYAGSKGSDLNISQIMACVGQQNVEGKRIPFGFHKRSLPHFSKDDYGPESKGFVENCYLNGLTPQEFYFHAMGGREGLIDTAVKTAETGYIQRRLIKALEDVMVKYDGTVRTTKEQVIQFLYGEDGMAGEHIEDLSINLFNMTNQQVESKCNFLPTNMRSTELEQMLSKSMDTELAQKILSDPSMTLQLQEEYKQILKDRDDLRFTILKGQDDKVHLSVNVPRIIWNAKEQFNIRPNSKSNLHPSYVLEKLKTLVSELTPIPGVNIKKDPLLIQANDNSTWLFKIYLRQLLSSKICIQGERLSQDAFDWIVGEIKSRFEQSLSNPGEMVGSIAAQSIGEPATQMTLNTFLFAGVPAKIVSLGVPRLKEIINVAKNIKTPSMKIYLQSKYKNNMVAVTKFGGTIEHTTLSHVVKNSAIYYDPDPLKTIVKEDESLIALYNDVPLIQSHSSKPSPWLLRFELDNDKMQFKDLQMALIEKKIYESFQDQINVMHSDDNAEKLILRLRVNDVEDDEEETVCMFLKEFQDRLFNELALKGIHEISKVTFTKYNESEFSPETGKEEKSDDNWLIETDGVALQKVLGSKKIDFTRTISNDLIEILKVLGIEAVRISLINELRFVLGSYGIYVNYRHLSTLCDVMTQRGILTSITRHGINRVDTGPLRKCSFEETVEILLEAAFFAETDQLKGITENIIMGQLAPFGTGSFDLVIDSSCLQDYAQSKPDEEENLGGDTVCINDDQNRRNEALYSTIGTPIVGNTPAYNNYGGESVYSQMTPNPMGGFSPGPNNFDSPMLYPSSPVAGQTPMNYSGYSMYRPNQSPIYQPYQSPIYQPGDAIQSPVMSHHQQSPSYSPTSNARQGQGIGSSFSPAYHSGNIATSPVYQTSGSQSPSYSPSQPMSGSGSGSYSPTNYNMTSSPRYSPTTPNYNQYSPQYSPTSNVYGGTTQSPRYQAHASPRYSIDSGQSGNQSSVNQSPTSQYNPNSMYIPASPAYNPASPAYVAQQQQSYNPNFRGGGGSPIDDNEDNDNGNNTITKKPDNIKKEN